MTLAASEVASGSGERWDPEIGDGDFAVSELELVAKEYLARTSSAIPK